jgi:hypothetical protein
MTTHDLIDLLGALETNVDLKVHLGVSQMDIKKTPRISLPENELHLVKTLINMVVEKPLRMYFPDRIRL